MKRNLQPSARRWMRACAKAASRIAFFEWLQARLKEANFQMVAS